MVLSNFEIRDFFGFEKFGYLLLLPSQRVYGWFKCTKWFTVNLGYSSVFHSVITRDVKRSKNGNLCLKDDPNTHLPNNNKTKNYFFKQYILNSFVILDRWVFESTLRF